jgi:spore photoproduct lyase
MDVAAKVAAFEVTSKAFHLEFHSNSLNRFAPLAKVLYRKIRDQNIMVDDEFMQRSEHLIQNDLIFEQKHEQNEVPILGFKPMKVHYQDYKDFDGNMVACINRIGDGSIIKRFDKTPIPERPNDVVCPHFLELKWAYGCPFKCSWCYLQGTFRFLKTKTNPVIKDRAYVERTVLSFLNYDSPSEMLNSGEVGDSLMGENSDSFAKFIIPIFENQKKHKILFLTKSVNINHLLENPNHKQTVVSFSLNADDVAKIWEIGAPSVSDRIKAAKELSEAGYEVRIRIDPIVPLSNWENSYQNLICDIIKQFIPERITLGSLRGLQSTITNSRDKSWVKYLSETSNWGKKVAFNVRQDNFQFLIDCLSDYEYTNIGLCKETVQMWDALGLNWRKIKCNCLI